MWIEIKKDDFLDAIKRLKPTRMPKSYALLELQIAFQNGEAIFCVSGAETRRPARGEWKGFVCVRYGLLLPFLKIKPVADPVKIEYVDSKIKIEITKLSARWIEASELITTATMNAHFLSGAPQKVEFKFCPSCGKKKGMNLGLLPMKSKLNAEELRIQMLADNTSANTGCLACGYGWIEIN